MKRRDFLLLPGAMAMVWNQASAKVEILRIGFVQLFSLRSAMVSRRSAGPTAATLVSSTA
jgi:hypothetical protein